MGCCGAFLELEPSSPQEEESDQSTEEGEPGDELDVTKRRIANMEEELEDLKKQIEQEKERADELWRVNCIQLTTFDSALIAKDDVIAQKDDEIAHLRRELGLKLSAREKVTTGGAKHGIRESEAREFGDSDEDSPSTSKQPFQSRRGKLDLL